MRFHNAPKRNLQDKTWHETSSEIKPDWPDWKKAGLIALVIIGIYAAIIGSQDLLQAQKAMADELLYHHLDREWPRPNNLIYVPFGYSECLHLARFDPQVGQFYDDVGWLSADKWLYVMDRWPDEARTCTSKDLVVDHD